MKALWNGQVIAESDDIVMVDGNPYFPEESIKKEFFVDSETHTECHWKGTASYYSITVNGETNLDAAWYYPETSDLAKSIKGRIAFWNGVEVLNE